MWYNSSCLDRRNRGVLLLNAVIQHNTHCGQSAPYQVDSRPAVCLGNYGKPDKGRFALCNLYALIAIKSLPLIEEIESFAQNLAATNQGEVLSLIGCKTIGARNQERENNLPVKFAGSLLSIGRQESANIAQKNVGKIEPLK